MGSITRNILKKTGFEGIARIEGPALEKFYDGENEGEIFEKMKAYLVEFYEKESSIT